MFVELLDELLGGLDALFCSEGGDFSCEEEEEKVEGFSQRLFPESVDVVQSPQAGPECALGQSQQVQLAGVFSGLDAVLLQIGNAVACGNRGEQLDQNESERFVVVFLQFCHQVTNGQLELLQFFNNFEWGVAI